jgi:saccharopine dehydrogenase (NAD+, L-lysine forming)
MKHIIGIRHEDKYVMERRVPIIPGHVNKLIRDHGIEIQIEKSAKRIFAHEEFESAGAKVVDNLKEASVIFGVKEIPEDYFEEGKTYTFFSHVVKGQSYNMPMLRKMMEKKVNLIEYEKIENDQGQRLIFFGRFAGLAGMINSLWSLGERFRELGIETPFLKIRQSHTYKSLDEARAIISEVGQEITESGLPAEITPLTIGFTGYGNVSQGAQEIAGLLPVREISPKALLDLRNRPNLPRNVLYKIVFKESDLSAPVDSNTKFELQDYYAHPEKYRSVFEKYIPHLTLLMNCMYWDSRYPKIVTKDYLEKLFKNGTPKLTVIGDITCDPDGSIECTHKGTEIEDPVFVYHPFDRKPIMGFKGEGMLVMAVDILPSELPRESSIAFSTALLKYIPAIATCNYSENYEALSLPAPIKNAMILHLGKLTPEYKYLSQHI